MFYNKDIFDKQGVPYPPKDGNWTWDDYKNMLPKLTHGEGANKVYGGFFMQWIACVQNLTVQSGKHITVSRDYSYEKYAYDLITGMQNEGTIIPYALIQSNNLRHESTFLQEKVATVYQGSWMFNPLLDAYNKGTLKFNWDVCVAPYPPDGHNGQAVGTAFIGSINSNAANTDHAWGYLKALISDEGAKIISELGDIPAMATDEIYDEFAKIPGMASGIIDALKYDELYFEVAMHDLAGLVAQPANETHQLIMTNSISVDEGLKEKNRRVAPIWADYDAGKIK
jgi:multiple sugar transport system substrate-binding protein